MLLLLATTLTLPAAALTLKQAEDLALQSDPLVASQLATSRALQNESTASGTLPDPKLRLGMFNVPLDSFDLKQNPTTQLRLGLQQQFPRGDVLDIKAERASIKSQAAKALAEDTRRKILRDLREAFLNVYYESEAARVITDSRSLFSKLVKITEDQYAAGRVNQQDVIRADLELSRLDDRYTKILSKEDQYRAVLAQWIGDVAWQDLDRDFPQLVTPQLADVNTLITSHPLILAQSAEVDAARKLTEIAQQDYSPGYNAFIEYRKRFGENPDGSDRSDLMAAMVTMDIPLFTANRQDKTVAASEEKANAARFMLDDKLRMLKRMFDRSKAMYQRSAEREKIYRDSLISSAKNNSSASLNAYQSGVSEFTTLMRAQITELDVRLNDLRVRVDKAIAQARLLYITGE
jgi:outer membrane protein TolC